MENVNLKVGLNASVETWVSQKSTAEEYGSGNMDVYATPHDRLDGTCCIVSCGPASAQRVYHRRYCVNIKHIAGTPVGMKVKALAELIAVEGRKLTFKVEAFDGVEKSEKVP